MSEHTKGVLEVVEAHGVATGVGVCAGTTGGSWNSFRMVANTMTNAHKQSDIGEIAANAERIVRAWNRDDVFDELLAALKNTAAALTTCMAHFQLSMNRPDYEARDECLIAASRAIAKATPQPETAKDD